MKSTEQNIANNLLIVGLVLLALYFGKALIIPFVIALVVLYLLNSLSELIGRIRVNDKKLSKLVQNILSILVLSTVTIFIGRLVVSNFEEFVQVYPQYHENILQLTAEISQDYNLPMSMDEFVQELDLPNMLSEILNSSLGFIGNLVLVIIYVIFLALEQQIFGKKLQLMFHDREKYHRFLQTTRKIDKSIDSYVSVKTSLCLLAAVSSFIILKILDIDFAVLWAFLIFLFNYIPIVGAFLGVLFPTIIAFLQYPDSYVYSLLVLILITVVQFAIGNFIEPKVLGNRLNLSPLVVILSLSFWGALWGIAGMFLCVPITVILMIIFSQFPKTKKIAVLLSGGKVI